MSRWSIARITWWVIDAMSGAAAEVTWAGRGVLAHVDGSGGARGVVVLACEPLAGDG